MLVPPIPIALALSDCNALHSGNHFDGDSEQAFAKKNNFGYIGLIITIKRQNL